MHFCEGVNNLQGVRNRRQSNGVTLNGDSQTHCV